VISQKHCAFLLVLIGATFSSAQQPEPPKPASAVPRAPRVAYYIDSMVLDTSTLLPPPPEPGSGINAADLAEVHRVEDARSPQQVAAAQADDAEEDMFVFKTVLGPGFTAEALPITAALGAHVKNEQSVVGNQLKRAFQRPRPYQADTTLHPVCSTKSQNDSYPSGHGMTGYLEAFTLAEMIPEKRTEILARADEYAHNRVVCGVHYPGDVEASRRASYIVFGYMLATPRFQRDLAAAREELSKARLTKRKDN
jgi:acid phosphatase (class A)